MGLEESLLALGVRPEELETVTADKGHVSAIAQLIRMRLKPRTHKFSVVSLGSCVVEYEDGAWMQPSAFIPPEMALALQLPWWHIWKRMPPGVFNPGGYHINPLHFPLKSSGVKLVTFGLARAYPNLAGVPSYEEVFTSIGRTSMRLPDRAEAESCFHYRHAELGARQVTAPCGLHLPRYVKTLLRTSDGVRFESEVESTRPYQNEDLLVVLSEEELAPSMP